MSSNVDIQRLRSATLSQQAAILGRYQHIVNVTEQLISAAATGQISTLTVKIWLTIATVPTAAVECLQQTQNAIIRRVAISHVAKFLRLEDSFTDTWDLLGGARGIAVLMSTFSVVDLKGLVKGFLRSAYSKQARRERQKRMTELFHVLNDPAENAETRPVKHLYRHIIPACTPELALQWKEGRPKEEAFPGCQALLDADPFERDHLVARITEAHWDVLEEQAFDEIFNSTTDSKADLGKLRDFIRQSTPFGIKILEAFTRSNTLRGIEPKDLMTKLILHMAKRCIRHPASPFWAALDACLQKHPSLADGQWMARETNVESLETKGWRSSVWRKGLLEYYAVRWSSLPPSDEADAALATFISIIPEKYVKMASADEIVFKVSAQRRYDFLRLFYQHACLHRFDINSTTGTSAVLKDLKIDAATFLQLPSAEAVELFERFREANPQYGTLNPGYCSSSPHADILSLMNHPNSEDESLKPDAISLRIYLLQRAWLEGDDATATPGKLAAMSQDLRRNELPRRKKKATQGSKPEVRALWANAALSLCVAMNDIYAYAETLDWARRFNKDALTVKSLYAQRRLAKEPTLSFFAVLPLSTPVRIGNLGGKITMTNKLIMMLIETACMALREPLFSVHDWLGVLQLPGRVVQTRLGRLYKAQDSLDLTDDEALDMILLPSIDLLLEAETVLLRSENSGLNMQHPQGLLRDVNLDLDTETWPQIVMFLEVLAQRRDELWTKHRAATNPSVISLGAPWPRGLPVQCLLPSFAKSNDMRPYLKDATWIQERAKAVVFCDGAIVHLPATEDEEEWDTVGGFVDSWREALQIYLRGAEGEADGRDRINQAMRHATETLAGYRLNRQEAQRFWHDQFVKAGVDEKLLKADAQDRRHERRPALLPRPENAPVEWDPDPDYNLAKEAPVRDRRLNGITRLDCMLQTFSIRYPLPASTKPEAPRELTVTGIPGTQDPYWSMRWQGTEGPYGELISWGHSSSYAGLVYSRIATAILCLNSSHGAVEILLEPFPSDTEQPVFPAMYLDQDFLERQGHGAAWALSALEDSAHTVPAALLQQLAASIFQRLRTAKTENYDTHQAFVSIVRLIIQGARPDLGCAFVKQYILDKMESSGWHRHLFNPGVMSYLPPSDAESLFVSMSDAIVEKLQWQKKQPQVERKPDGDADDKSGTPTNSGSLIKVTTVKMIAELLRESNVVKPSLAVDVLTRILQHGSHIDIRLAAIESLIHAFGNNGLKDQIVHVLETHAVPLASALNERSPAAEDAEWAVAESGGDLPTISDQTLVMDMLISSSSYAAPEFSRLASLALQELARKNSRWMALFVKKHKLNIDPDILPKIPVHPAALLNNIRRIDVSSISLYEFGPLRSYVLFFLNPPKSLRDANKRIRDSPEIYRSSAGKRWLALWGKGPGDNVRTYGCYFAQQLRAFAFTERSGKPLIIPTAMLEDFIVTTAKIIVHQGDLGLFRDLWSALIIDRDEDGKAITDDGPGKVIKQLIELIDGLRTPEWQADRNRQPSVLPSTLPLRLRLLPFPSWSKDLPRSTAAYAVEIIHLLEEITETGSPYYYPQYKLIEDDVATSSATVSFAIELGKPSKLNRPETPTLVDCLRVNIAAKVLSKINAKKASAHDLKAAESMVSDWRESAVEEFRDLARNVPTVYKPDAGSE